MTFQERFNLIPPCLRAEDGGATVMLNDCLLGSLSYYIELLIILVGVTAFFYIVYAGIQMATAFGNESKYAAAKNTLLHAIIGIIIATLAYTIVSFVTGFFGVKSPKIYNPETGEEQEEIKNDPAFVTALVAIQARTTDPGSAELTDEELQFVASNGTTGGTQTTSGSHASILLTSTKIFIVQFEKADGSILAPVTGEKNGVQWARYYASTKELKGGKLTVYEEDPKTGHQHYREVTIK